MPTGSSGRPARPVREFRPGLEALRLAIHRPDDVGHRLEAALFRDDLQREAFLVLAEADPDAELHQVIDSAPPEVRALLVRLTVEEPRGEPDDVVLQLVRDAARGELLVITAEARTSPEAVTEAAAAAVLGPGAGRSRCLGRGDGQVGSLACSEGTEGNFGTGFVTADQSSPSLSVVPRPVEGPASGSLTGAARRPSMPSRPISSRPSSGWAGPGAA